MDRTQKRVFALLLATSALYFSIFIFPNNTGAKDQMMISLFEPDEFAQYPVATQMIAPEDSVKQNLINFFIYGHYYYGWLFYALSAITILPVVSTQGFSVTQLNMLLLRQIVSILPMLGALLLLTFTQTKFRSYIKSIGLFILLLSVSAVVENSMWWHVDSLAVFFCALVIFFLDKDDQRYGRDFYLAAASTGLAAGVKVIGFFFVLAIPAYLLIGILQNRLTWRIASLRGAAFVGIMFAVIFIANPFMIYRSQLVKMVETISAQASSQTIGWTLAYAKGPASWLPIIKELYGQLTFIALAFVALGLGIWRSENRTRHILIALWSIPFGLYVLYAIAIKPTHFFLPILLPVYSSMVVLFEFPPFSQTKSRPWYSWVWGGLALAVIIYQFSVYIAKDAEMYREVLTREEHEASLIFYETLESNFLPRIPADAKLVAFRDVRMYLPNDSRWTVRSYWNSKYSTIEQIQPDMVILWSQRILDYTQQGAQESAVDPESFQDTYEFYVDADKGQLRGYRLVYRDAEGLFFVTDELYDLYFRE